ncbi:nuclear transport factor 2 family protein [Dactylosporangium sp. CA-092794]|uniref:nuclear transport factor 2 family protein n=1 Tax=Dactylosporangium sp. CA-092794 TaxID=3239929 RepID=UPI003D92654E
MSAADVLRKLYAALSTGDVPGLIACIDPDVIVDEPPALPYGGVHHGRDVFLQSILGTMMGHAAIELTEYEVFENETGAIGKLVGTLTAHTTGEVFPLTMIEVHDIVGETSRKIDVYIKDPAALAAFYARSEKTSA